MTDRAMQRTLVERYVREHPGSLLLDATGPALLDVFSGKSLALDYAHLAAVEERKDAATGRPYLALLRDDGTEFALSDAGIAFAPVTAGTGPLPGLPAAVCFRDSRGRRGAAHALPPRPSRRAAGARSHRAVPLLPLGRGRRARGWARRLRRGAPARAPPGRARGAPARLTRPVRGRAPYVVGRGRGGTRPRPVAPFRASRRRRGSDGAAGPLPPARRPPPPLLVPFPGCQARRPRPGRRAVAPAARARHGRGLPARARGAARGGRARALVDPQRGAIVDARVPGGAVLRRLPECPRVRVVRSPHRARAPHGPPCRRGHRRGARRGGRLASAPARRNLLLLAVLRRRLPPLLLRLRPRRRARCRVA